MANIPHRKSRHLLPLNSMIFKSKSSINLRSTSQRNIYTKSNITLTHVEEPEAEVDNSITALPSASPRSVRRQPKSDDLAATSSKSSDEDEHVKKSGRSKSMADLGDEERKESMWRRLIQALKKPFRRETEVPEEPKEPQRIMVIGSPTDFKHVQTGTACLAALQREISGTVSDWETVRVSESRC